MIASSTTHHISLASLRTNASSTIKIRETFHMIDVNGNGELDLAELRPILEEEYQAGESGASISEDAQVWVHIMEELERDGIRPVSYNEFYDAILVVI